MNPKMDPAHNPYPVLNLEETEIRLHDGRRLTDKIADELSEEITRETRRGRGRPALSEKGGRAAQVTFKLSNELRSLADQRAKRDRRKVSEIAREALEVFLADDEIASRRTVRKSPARKTVVRKATARKAAKKVSKPAVKKTTRKR
jgi:hypothetical protein